MCDSTDDPTPGVLLSPREVGLKNDGPALDTGDCSGYAPAVQGDDTLSCSSPPNFSDMNITHEKKHQPQGGSELERTPVTPTLMRSSVLCFSDAYTEHTMSVGMWI